MPVTRAAAVGLSAHPKSVVVWWCSERIVGLGEGLDCLAAEAASGGQVGGGGRMTPPTHMHT